MAQYVDFVESLIYGTGLNPNPNHQTWLGLALPGGTDWLTHYLDRMLPAYEAFLAAESLPPVTPWDGVKRAPWDAGLDLPLGADLDGSFTGVATLDALGTALRNRYTQVSTAASELSGLLKAPFGYRFWSYLKWGWTMRERFLGRQVFPIGIVYDRDGTILSPTPFCDAFNDGHRNWHVGATPPVAPTPGFRTTAGQRVSRGIVAGFGEDFLRFHREHLELFQRWIERSGQTRLRPVDMGRTGGAPPVPVTPTPGGWAVNEAGFTSGLALAGMTSIGQIGAIEGGYHVAGHGQNSDIGPLSHNNYVPRFHNWHGWIDAQWWWREPRFAQSDPLTGERNRVFRVVGQDGSDFPGLAAISIVRDPLLAADDVYPANSIGGLNLATGAGTLRMKLYVRDTSGRAAPVILRMRMRAEVLDAAGAVIGPETITVLRNIGVGGDHPFDTEFTEDFTFAAAFLSDDPARANPGVGFVNSRIRITGNLWVPGGNPDDPAMSPDAGFVHEDITTVDLVREKSAPEVLIYQDLASFSEDQVNSNLSGGQSVFNAFYVVAQDRTTASVPAPAWPAATMDEIKGLVLGIPAASGLWDDLAHPPEVVLWQDAADMPFNGVTVQLLGPPDKEDGSAPPEMTQRLTWRFSINFAAVNDAFTGLLAGGQRLARLRATVADRAGNRATVQATVKFFKDANPYMIDGPTSWLSVDTRSFTVFAGQSRMNETLTAGQPLPYLNAILSRLNNGTTGAETFDTLPTEGLGAALEYAAAVPNPSTGTPAPIYNFAVAKVRLQGAAGAAGVRAFFRLFRYAAPSLLFSENSGYRKSGSAGGTIVPLLGFESESAGAALSSIPFFATARVSNTAAAMTTQPEDTPNVHTFPAGPAGERVWYFGAWLDINDPAARMPATYQAADPDGPYPLVALQPLRTLMRDFHQCMVAEIRFDGDPTEPLASPASSDNLAQRNLVILSSDNPGDEDSRTVEHSFDIDLSRPRLKTTVGQQEPIDHTTHTHAHNIIPGALEPLEPGASRIFVNPGAFERMQHDEAMSIAMRTAEGAELMAGGDHHGILEMFAGKATANLRATAPFVFDPARWTQTAMLMDELRIRWNNLPVNSLVHLFLPGQSAEEIVSLRNLRHAPRTVHAQGGSVLRLDVGQVTYVPVPPVVGNRQAAMITVQLPQGVKAGERYTMDVTQLRAFSQVENGGFRVEIQVGRAAQILPAVERGVRLMQERLSLTRRTDRWRPILERRLATEMRRGQSLAGRAGVPWTVEPVSGMKIRVILERIRVLDPRELIGRGEIDFETLVRSENNGGVEQRSRFPESGQFKVAAGDTVSIGQPIFDGYAEDHLMLRIDGTERDKLTSDDPLGSYLRQFGCRAEDWIGEYHDTLRGWEIWYRIEKG